MRGKRTLLLLSLLGALSLTACGGEGVSSSSSLPSSSSSSRPSLDHAEILLANLLDTKSMVGTIQLETLMNSGSSLPGIPNTSIHVGGDFILHLPSLEEASFILSGDAQYNSADGLFEFTYVDQTAYARVEFANDLETTPAIRYKATESELGDVVNFFSDVTGVEMPSLDASLAEILASLTIEETGTAANGGYTYEASVTVGETPLVFTLTSDEDCYLTSVEGTFTDSSSVTSFVMNVNETNSDTIDEVTAPVDADTYRSLVSDLPLFEGIADLANSSQFGFSLSLDSLQSPDFSIGEGTGLTVTLSGNLDQDTGHSNMTISLQEENGEAAQSVSVYSDDSYGYINYDDALKLAFPASELNEFTSLLMEDFPLDESFFQDIFSGILGNEAVTELLLGDYSSIIEAVTSIEQNDDHLLVTFSGESFGFGELSLLTVSLSHDKLLSLEVENFSLNSSVFSFHLDLLAYEEVEIVKEEYTIVEGLPSIYNQFSSLVASPRFNLAIDGEMNGQTLEGNMQVDASAESLSLDLNVDEIYSYVPADSTEAVETPYTHQIAIDLMPTDVVAVNYNYVSGDTEVTPDEELRGYISEASLSSIGQAVSTLMDGRVGDLLSSSLSEIALLSAINKAVNEKNYHDLLNLHFVKAVSSNADGILLTLDLSSAGLEGDTTLLLTQKDTGELESLTLESAALGSLSFTLEATTSPLTYATDYSTNAAAYTDFSSLSLLVEALGRDAELTTHHLSINLDINALIVHPVLKGDLYIDSSTSDVRVYGSFVREDYNILGSLSSETAITLAASDGMVYTKIGEERSSATYDEYSADLMSNIMGILGIPESFMSMMTEDTSHPYYFDSILTSYSFAENTNTISLGLDLGDLSRMTVGGTPLDSINVSLAINESGFLSSIAADGFLLAGGLPISAQIDLLDIGLPISSEVQSQFDEFVASFNTSATF